MPSISTDQGSLHYEVSGKGRPVVFLHGYLGSWGLWKSTMADLDTTFRTYAVDFWGFGESGARRPSYAIDDFVSLVDQFMEQLGVVRAPLVGHSMGGSVALMVAARYPHRVTRVVAVGAPIVGSSLRFFPRIFGRQPVGRLMYRNLWLYRRLYRLLAPAYSRDPRWADIMDRDLSHVKLEAFFASIGSLRQVDLRAALVGIDVPVLGMYGGTDRVVDPGQSQLLKECLPEASVERFAKCGHFIMLDDPEGCTQRLRSFLDDSSIR
jgi:pimeloyl-ACP methyl ester carboxylesterase